MLADLKHTIRRLATLRSRVLAGDGSTTSKSMSLSFVI
jgi:hypothetical protein